MDTAVIALVSVIVIGHEGGCGGEISLGFCIAILVVATRIF